ncbi:MAG TPA: dihydrolipoyl dehydrogenase [Dongiaceae bacterium]|nr:dihydrolipoyl dehydrogenase [Dongiaceae bacterium]
MGDITTKVLILGGGPGGYVTAIRAGQLGLDTVLVEDQALGGTCLNVGCIPSKALIHAAETYHNATALSVAAPFGVAVAPPSLNFTRTVEWKDGIVGRLKGGVAGLLKRSSVKIIKGLGTFLDGKTVRVDTDTGTDTIRAECVVIATGSEPLPLRTLPFGGRVISSTEALSLAEVPRRLAVVGAGYIGLELGIAFAKLGASVTVVEATDRILPLYDGELTRPVAQRLAELGIELRLETNAEGLSANGESLIVTGRDGAPAEIGADRILVAIGRRPRTSGFGLERLDLSMNGNFIRIDERCATSMRNVWAVGDVTGEPMLAHRAMTQGEMVAEIIAGHRRSFDKRAIPAVCFTDPEIVSVGLTPDEAKAAGLDIKVGRFSFQTNGRAMTLQAEQGFVRVTARSDNHLLLGIHAVGAGVSEMSTAFGLALEMGATLEDIAHTIHAHPTLGEAFQESALKALGHALHA